MRRSVLGTVIATLALVAGVVIYPASNTRAAGGTITLTNTKLTYTDGPFVVPNPTDQLGPPTCSAATPCDDFALGVNVPAGTDATKQITIRFDYDQSIDPLVDFDIWVYDSTGAVIAQNTSGVSPSIVTIPAISGNYIVRADPWFPGGESYTGTITLDTIPTASTSPDAATQASGSNPRYQTYAAPSDVGGTSAGEPSIGVNWNTGNVMMTAGLQTLKVRFTDSTSPAQATWSDVSAFNTSKFSLDPILFTDHTTGRTIVSQLTGQDSLSAYTDNDGGAWTPSQGGGIPSGVDHQTVGGGPYSASAPLPAPNAGMINGYRSAFYYCSQDIATAFCARSDDGGLTFGAGVPIYNMTQCAGIHGHVKVAPDGTVYVPTRSCGGKQGVAVSTDNGTTWTVRVVPDSTPAVGNDPSVGIGSDGTVYFGYQGADGRARIAVSHDRGVTWTKSVDVGALAGVRNVVFPAVVAGDANRAAFAYLGSTTGGDFQSQPNYNGVWYLFISSTYDGGKTWTTVNATPNDPVQRGSICISGTTCSNTPDDRNLLDFIDASIDSQGRVLVGYADGCVAACVAGNGATDPTNTSQSTQSQLNSFTAVASIARQSGGRPLFAQYDPTEPAAPARPSLRATEASAGGPVTLSWQAPDNGGSPITSYRIYRGTSPGGESQYANAGTHLSYVDNRIKAGMTYYYKLVAINKVGASPASPEVTPSIINPRPMCSAPGALVLGDPVGDQTGAPNFADLDLTGLYIAQPPNTGNLVFSIKVANLATPGAQRQWRVFWDADNAGNRWYVGMDTDVNGNPWFVYGMNTGQSTGVKYAPAIPTSTYTALPGSKIDTANNIITVVVPRSGVGNPAPGSTLPNVQARTFAGQGDVTTASTNLAVDYTGFGTYTLVADSYCTG